MLGDFLYVCPLKYLAEQLAEAGNKVFAYLFGHKPERSHWNESLPSQYEDLKFLFGTPLRHHWPDVLERKLSRRLVELISHFAKTG